ncbi:hypothetical protein [Clostridium butyricum]|uniref:hypothetical protein n=2 Tax=Clostridium butyricum TaxID=1492 RepID=UPI002AB0E654|nr:hypothetical protein [Clostridium butyricum]
MYFKYYSFFMAIANTGLMTRDIALKSYSVNQHCLKCLLKKKLIIHKGNFILYGKVTNIYSLSNNTKNYIRNLGKAPYKSNISQLEHDYLLLKTYSSLPEYIQKTWLNETELKALYNGITVDGVFLLNHNLIGVEIITPNYTKNTILEKKQFGHTHCKDLIVMNTNDISIKERR